MTKRTANPLRGTDDGVTYSTGLGFVPGNLGPAVSSQIRLMSNVICGALLLNFLCQKLFFLPFTYLGRLLGLKIIINYYSQMVIMSENSRLLIQYSVSLVSLLVSFLVLRFCFFRPLSVAKIFRRPQPGTTAVALPILAAAGILSYLLAQNGSRFLQLFGIVLDSFPGTIGSLGSATWITLAGALAFSLMQELIFRGVILYPLRKFGDGFAVVAASLMGAVVSEGLTAGIAIFLYGLVAGYFVIRSGSIRTALLGRTLVQLLLFAFRIISGMLEPSLASVIGLVALILLLGGAVFSVFCFLRLDPHAFHLIPFSNAYPIGYRIGAFCTGLLFLVQAAMLLYRMAHTIQIIGW